MFAYKYVPGGEVPNLSSDHEMITNLAALVKAGADTYSKTLSKELDKVLKKNPPDLDKLLKMANAATEFMTMAFELDPDLPKKLANKLKPA